MFRKQWRAKCVNKGMGTCLFPRVEQGSPCLGCSGFLLPWALGAALQEEKLPGTLPGTTSWWPCSGPGWPWTSWLFGPRRRPPKLGSQQLEHPLMLPLQRMHPYWISVASLALVPPLAAWLQPVPWSGELCRLLDMAAAGRFICFLPSLLCFFLVLAASTSFWKFCCSKSCNVLPSLQGEMQRNQCQ